MTGAEMVRTAIFGFRNAEKTRKGHIGRSAVCLGQTKNLFDAVQKLDCSVAESARSASEIFNKACQNDALLDGFSKFSDMCSKNINPLIWASAGLDIALADDKKEALVQNVAAVGTMRLAEEFMKKNNHLDRAVDTVAEVIKDTKLYNKVASSNMVKTLAEKAGNAVAKSDSKMVKMIAKGGAPALTKGVLFVVGSCLAYDAGRKFGNLLLGKDKES